MLVVASWLSFACLDKLDGNIGVEQVLDTVLCDVLFSTGCQSSPVLSAEAGVKGLCSRAGRWASGVTPEASVPHE